MLDIEKYPFIKSDEIYDIETYPNCFCVTFQDAFGGKKVTYEISRRHNDLELLLDHLRNSMINEKRMVGFNNKGFDYPVLHWIIQKAIDAKQKGYELKITANQIYKYAMKVISSNRDGSFGITVKEKDVLIKQLDLYKINHFDNKAKRTSLKLLEFNMRSDNVEDLPFDVGMNLNSEQIDVLIHYNQHDVAETRKFYILCLDMIKFRDELSVKYGFDCTNMNDTKIGEQFFISRMEKENPNAFYYEEGGRKKMKQTKRDFIKIKECIFPYITFSRPEFKAVKEWLEAQVITETKGVFSDIEEHKLLDVAKYAEMVTKKVTMKNPHNVDKAGKPKNDFDLDNPTHASALEEQKKLFKKDHPMGWFEMTPLTKTTNRVKVTAFYRIAKNLHVIIDGFRYDYGTGGIHGSIRGVVQQDEEWEVWDWDVASFYPNMAIANRLYPEHLNESFCDGYQDFYNERGNYAKGTGENKAIKLGLNATYGNSNNEYSVFYDPKYTMSITIGGQLSLCMLIERLIDICGVKIIQCNTDGFTVKVKKDQIETMKQHVKRWEKVTGLTMEDAQYEVMYIRDVNNYIARYTNGKLKMKGAYEYKDLRDMKEGFFHKNHSSFVVQMAVEHYLSGKGSVEDFIRNHDDKYDFMLRAKVPRSSKLVLEKENGEEELLPNICRYYISEGGGKLIKVMPPLKDGKDRRLGINVEWNVKPCNNIKDFVWDINYEYYIQEANKLIDPFSNYVYENEEDE